MLRFTVPEVPVTVSVEVPGAVPFGVDVPLLPPLQPISSSPRSTVAVGRAKVAFSRRSAARRASIANRASAKATGSSMRRPPTGRILSGSVRGVATERAVVATATENGEAVLPLNVTEVGEREHVAPAGAPLQVSVTAPLNPNGTTWRL